MSISKSLLLLSLCAAGCATSYYYVPIRPVTTAMPISESGQRCWRQCMGIARTCEAGCRLRVEGGVEVHAMVDKLAQVTKECKDRCADQRDECLKTCK
jgi:hypothetical protein